VNLTFRTEVVVQMAKTIITVTNISKSFGKTQAVRDLSFSVESGSCFGFLGPNGAGKTTAMKIIYGNVHLGVRMQLRHIHSAGVRKSLRWDAGGADYRQQPHRR